MYDIFDEIKKFEKEMEELLDASGVKLEDVSIKVDSDYLIINGKREDPFFLENCNYYAMEIDFGQFERIIRFPVDVEIEKLSVTNENGFLKIVLPKKNIVEKEIKIE